MHFCFQLTYLRQTNERSRHRISFSNLFQTSTKAFQTTSFFFHPEGLNL